MCMCIMCVALGLRFTCKPALVAVALTLVIHSSVYTRRAVAEKCRKSLCPLQFVEDNFTSSVRASVERLSLEHRPLLVHTRIDVR